MDEGSRSEVRGFRNFEPRTLNFGSRPLASLALHAPRSVALADFFSILLGSRRELVRQKGHVFLLKGEMDDQEDDPHADRRVGYIKGRPMVRVHIDIEEIDHLAVL